MNNNIEKFPKLKAAFEHVRSFHPSVTTVVFDAESRWRYFGDSIHDIPTFGNKTIDVSILEDAQREVDDSVGFPCLFYYGPDKSI